MSPTKLLTSRSVAVLALVPLVLSAWGLGPAAAARSSAGPGTTGGPLAPAAATGSWSTLGAPAAVAGSAGHVDLFFRGPGGALVHRTRTGSRWSSEQFLGGVLTSAPAATADRGGVRVFGRGTTGGLYEKASSAQNAWSGWVPLGGVLTGRPAAAASGGRLDVFAPGMDGALWTRSADAAGRWSGWSSLGGRLAPGTGAAAVATGRGAEAVAVVGVSGSLYVLDGSPSGQWSAWRSLGGRTASDPALTAAGERVELFVRGTDGALWRRDAGSAAAAWRTVGGVLGAGPAATTPPGSHIADVVVLGSNARYYTGSEDVGTGGWSGWTLVPGLPLTATCRAAARPARWNHVIWVWMENKSYASVIGRPTTPYLNFLAAGCGLATSYSALSHPSLPNYIGATAGSTFGITDDADPLAHPISAPSIFSQTGSGWRAYEESMPSPCALTNSGLYAVRHNPAAYYTSVRTACQTQDLPLPVTPDLGARFTFVTPNLCNDTHDCPTATGDRWLAAFVPKVLASPQYAAGDTLLVVTWDEGAGTNNTVATVVVAPTVPPGTRSATPYTHYSLLRTTEELLGLPLLGAAATATSMRPGFGL